MLAQYVRFSVNAKTNAAHEQVNLFLPMIIGYVQFAVKVLDALNHFVMDFLLAGIRDICHRTDDHRLCLVR